jgi:ABC-2 type transport system permease protein
MTLESLRYRGWSQRLRPTWLSCWPIARTGLTLVLRRKMFWFFLALALFSFLFVFSTIYLNAQIREQNPGLERFFERFLSSVTGTGETYREFMFAQGTVTMLLLSFAGAVLVGDDLQQGGVLFYLSRRLGRLHYVLGKLLSIGLLVAMTTTLPTLILYFEYGLLTSSMSYFQENLSILRGILAYGLIMAVTLSLLLFALTSWLRDTVPVVMSWATVFVLLPALGQLLSRVYDNRYWQLLMLWRDVRLLGIWCFGAIDNDREAMLIHPAMAIVAGVCILSSIAIIPRVRAVKVVT